MKKAYFVGIGGIGMSAIARYFHKRGVAVSGYDKTATTLTRKLEQEGMKIHYTEDVSAIPEGIDLVVYTPAVPANHAELQHFRKLGFPLKKRAEVLGIISRSMRTIAIAGTHGKTTTSSMVAHVLQTGGIDCTAFLGGIAGNFDSNYVLGQSEWMVVEADEYDRSFLHLSPDKAVITSMDPDHLDIYGDAASILETGFLAFARRLKPGGQLWVQHRFTGEFGDFPEVMSYGLDGGNYRSENLRVENGFFTFDYRSPQAHLKGLELALPGAHNVENATAAITIGLELGLSEDAIRRALRNFKGVKRRFETIFRDGQRVYIDDYAHHPSELRAAIAAARMLYPGRKLTGIFQPHLYSRTQDFADGFADALSALDEIILLDIYPAREAPIPGVSSELIFDQIDNPAKELVTKSELMSLLAGKSPEVLLTLGAGDIDTFVEPIADWLKGE
ncbi:UDP-N-acetylmuramate--L-alanine ligase [Flavilitoribacter nigricans DSM 23189 = NBRC 102662]|uniref:UDP-N-acetylmuramate--L-alanine ligase n=1 Tax=Flavilitoribacter nigricans (strain ATCC 23147 / DSM 23189 / NBRC 102662 / NCIMB 1420 / SS-2) TaxID=1122177 RepID=A0A2D0NA44_FLAN2|nr:UDP-N-acetylmuramate--L-alanine ligase [Flavilitoribacter nigricans DSM 23189 = NBRC 102662]